MSETSVFMFLTRSCNLACSHCYVSAEPQLKGHMSFDVFRRVVDFLESRGINDLRLTGGEPTLNPRFELMLEFLISKRITPRLITNGIRLMQMPSPQDLLAKLSRCWISVYGVTPEQHRSIGGPRSRSLEETLKFAGRQAEAGHWVGISALLTEIRTDLLKEFVARAKICGVRYLRFLFGEPSGRARDTKASFAPQVGQDPRALVDYLRYSIASDEFDFLSINNPFDLDSVHLSGSTSCMLSSRGMWSISPEGDIYSCCFNVYDSAHFMTSALSVSGSEVLTAEKQAGVYAPRCKALSASFWGTGYNGTPTCPISAITLIS